VSTDELIAVCATEWKPTARESERARLDAALAQTSAKASAVERYNAAVRALRRNSIAGLAPMVEERGQKSEIRGQEKSESKPNTETP
jgi:hypothetical protein